MTQAEASERSSPPASVTREVIFTLVPERVDDLLRVLSEDIVTLYHGLPSYRGSYAFGDRSRGFVAALTSWSGDDDLVRAQPGDIQTYVRDRHGIEIELQSVKMWDFLYEDRPAGRVG